MNIKKVKGIVTAIVIGTTVFALSQTALAKGKAQKGQAPKNVILMISDGQGYNAIRATNYYTGKTPVYENFKVKVAMQTFSANNKNGYDPEEMAKSFQYAMTGYTDSASAATAMYTGQKIYDSVINMTAEEDSKPLTTFFEDAAESGKSIGAISSVELSHATPAAVYGHNSSRNNYAALGYEGVYGSNPLNNESNSGDNPKAGNNDLYDSLNYYDNLKVLMGAGSGDYDDNGLLDTTRTDKYVGGTDAWEKIKSIEPPNGWTLVETKEDFEAVANGDLNPAKLLGVAQVNSTLQQSRSAGTPMNTNVPTLETMTKAALNVLDDNENGFAVMIEGGAIDWAGHANQKDRLIEEQIDFNNAVQAVVDYLDNNTNGNNWKNTLLIVTADHETGHLWGDCSGTYFDVNGDNKCVPTVDYSHVTDNGAGNLPGMQFNSGNHTNVLVPLYANGAGAKEFKKYVIGKDPNLREIYNLDQSWNGDYVDNTSIYFVMSQSLE